MIKSGDGKMTMADREDMNHKTNLHYEMEDLIPIVGKLAEKYTSYESTSITYEKAEQLMEAVLYCIHENALGQPGQESAMAVLPDNTGASLQQAYEAGAARAREKVKQALALYNEILPGLACYGNRFLQDIFMKELPVFFGRYDVDFAPQNEILTLDYPVLKDIFPDTGGLIKSMSLSGAWSWNKNSCAGFRKGMWPMFWEDMVRRAEI